MSSQDQLSRGTHFLLSFAAFVVLVAGMKAAASILVPFLVAVFLSIIAGPLVFWLKNYRVPAGLAVAIVVVLLISILTLIGAFVGSSLNRFLEVLPSYEIRLEQEISGLVAWLEARGVDVPDEGIFQWFAPASAMGVVASLLTSVGGMLTNTLLILLTVVFILLEASSFPGKVRAAFVKPEATLEGFTEFATKLNQYVAIKTAISLATGIAVASWNSAWGIDFALLWGLSAFLLNYIPTLGSIFASIPSVLLALLQFGPGTAVLVALGYVAINLALGSFLEPRFLGRGLGLSTLVVFLSLVIWAWVLGPVGMLLSVPLTMTLKIGLESSEKTRWIGVLLGPEAVGGEEHETHTAGAG